MKEEYRPYTMLINTAHTANVNRFNSNNKSIFINTYAEFISPVQLTIIIQKLHNVIYKSNSSKQNNYSGLFYDNNFERICSSPIVKPII